MNINKDYYNILGVNKNASEDEIKKMFKKLALKYHPDKNNGDKSFEEKFKEINEAYSILNDKIKKSKYDSTSKFGNNYSPYSNNNYGFNFDDIFNGFKDGFNFDNYDYFGSSFKNYSGYKENLDIKLNLNVSLKDIYNNNTIKLVYNKYISCPDCNGTGFDNKSESYTCDVCNGKGIYNRKKCPYCDGKGKIFSAKCKRCNGEKVILNKMEINLNNTYKIKLGNSEDILRGYGNQSKYFKDKKGNLILNIKYVNIDKYELLNDKFLLHNYDIHYQDAIDGSEIEYELLDDTKIKIKIPTKSKDKDIIRVKDKGLLISQNQRTELYIKLNIFVDYNRL
jgi:molecular chaperone DnaJ